MRATTLALTLMVVSGGAWAADAAKDGNALSASGILTEVKPDAVMIWIDGNDGPVKFKLADGFDRNTFTFPPKGKGIFTTSRVQFNYVKGDAVCTLLTVRKEATQATGKVTGTVLFSDSFWVAVKPKTGPVDGYAIGAPGAMSDRLKGLHKGDVVTIKYHTDIERHRIDDLQIVSQTSATGPANGATLKWPDSVKVLRDVEYAKVGDRRLIMDLFTPAMPKGKSPLVVWIYGCAWRGAWQRDRSLLGSNEVNELVSRGYVIASITHRLSSEAVFPAQIEDCKGAIRFLRANAAKYAIDPDHIGVWGASSGGHLSALLGTSGDVKDLEGDVGGNLNVSSRVQCVVDYFGPSDMNQFKGQPVWPKVDDPKSPLCQLVGGLLADKQGLVAKANPITFITKNCPPFFVAHGDKDNSVPFNQSQLLVDALKMAGVDVTFEVVKDGGHGFSPDQGQRLDPMVNAFLDRHLKGTVATQPVGQ